MGRVLTRHQHLPRLEQRDLGRALRGVCLLRTFAVAWYLRKAVSLNSWLVAGEGNEGLETIYAIRRESGSQDLLGRRGSGRARPAGHGAWVHGSYVVPDASCVGGPV